MTLQQHLSTYMNSVRLNRKQSINKFAEDSGVSRSSMQKILKGTCNSRIDTIKCIADNLDVNPEDMLFPPYDESHQEFALLLIRTLETFSNLPREKQENAASMFNDLILMMEENK